MTILSAVEDWKERETGENLTDGLTGTRVFQIQSDDPMELENAVYDACPVGFPDVFPGTLTCYLVERKARRDPNSRLVWYVTCSYKSILTQLEQQRVDFPNPLDRSTRIEWTARTVQRYVTKMQRAYNGSTKAYKLWDPGTFTFDGQTYSVSNTASDPFDPPLAIPTTEWIASVTKNITSPPTWFVGGYNDSVNRADVNIDGLTLKAGCGKMEGLRLSSNMQENGTAYRQLQFNIVCRAPRPLRSGESIAPDPWDEEVLNEGMRTFNTSSKWQNIVDSTGQAVSKPVPLDQAGNPIDPSGAPIAENLLTWVLFRPCLRKDWSVLPLT